MSAPFSDDDLANANRLLKIEAELNELVEGLRAHKRGKSDYAEPAVLIAEFFQRVGHHDLYEYIARHAMALFDLRFGIVDPSLNIKSDRSTQDPTIVKRGQMWVALAYECLRKTDMSHSEVAGEIIKHSDLEPLLRGKNASLGTSPKSWHDQFMDNEITNDDVQNSFNQVYRAIGLDKSPPREECLALARGCLVRARMFARSV